MTSLTEKVSLKVLANLLPIGQLHTCAKQPAILKVEGIGSSLVVVLHDRVKQVHALAHILLADSQLAGHATQGLSQPAEDSEEMPAQFADQAIPLLVSRFEKAGGNKLTASARLVGGAQLFNFGGGGGNPLNIGSRNAIACRALLTKHGMKVEKAEVGGNKIRLIDYHLDDGRLWVSVVGGAQPKEL